MFHPYSQPDSEKKSFNEHGVLIVLLLALCGIFFLVYQYESTTPSDFPTHTEIVIHEGLSVQSIATELEETNVISSSFFFLFNHRVKHHGESLRAGTYIFTEPLTLDEVTQALILGKHSTPLIKVTFPEGYKTTDFELYLKRPVDQSELTRAIVHTGYLFPDTYHISNTTSFSDIVTLMQNTYLQKIEPLRSVINNSGYTEGEIITLASIVEREANDESSMKLVSGILHNRLDANMPLQVDATFEYLLDKTSDELTAEDLNIDSPYNTYTNVGLPPTPISNPGLTAINAVLFPASTDYMYYLTDASGTFHYARTFEEHKRNKELFLR
jgi:UPF0755 protein